MIQISNKTNCMGCSACAAACPVGCIQMVRDQEGFLYPRVEAEKCIRCGVCLKTCPLAVSQKQNDILQAEAYAARSKNETIRAASSSGGVFSELAAWVLRRGGVVIGAAFQADFSVAHICVECEDNLALMRGAKYVQSDIGQSYTVARNHLAQGKTVLFSGTPCQIGGLYSFLGGDHENLITQDVICHGVPSPMVWRRYLEHQRRLDGGNRIRRIRFRDKITGWKQYSVTIEYEDTDRYCAPAAKNPMMKAFLKNLCLRPSCHACAFKQLIRVSDITLADFWGIEHILPEWDDNKGTSLVLLNSSKGREFFEETQSQLDVQEIDCAEAIKYNPSAIHSAELPKEREAFMRCVAAKGFSYAARKYLKTSFWIRVKAKIKVLFGMAFKQRRKNE